MAWALVISCNTYKKNPCMGKPMCRAIRKLGWRDALVCLQEVPKWVDGSVFGQFIVHSSRSRADRAANRDGFDCGFLVPASLNPLVREVCHGRYWSGMLLSGVVVFSVHFIHQHIEDSSTSYIDIVREETQGFFTACQNRYPNERLSVVAGFDANVTLPGNHLEITGECTLPP